MRDNHDDWLFLLFFLAAAYLVAAAGKRGSWLRKLSRVSLGDLVGTLFGMWFAGHRMSTGQPTSDLGLPQERAAASYKVGRNEQCPCGSGEKYKNCCGFRR